MDHRRWPKLTIAETGPLLATAAPGGSVPEQLPECGTGHLRSGHRDLGEANYEIHGGIPKRPGTVVELESPPSAQNGEVLDLTLEDGRVLQIQVSGVSPYCRVVGEGPATERRRPLSEASVSPEMEQGRRRSDARGPVAIIHPCPHCMAPEVLVTHRGVMLTTLFCTTCRHGWGEPPLGCRCRRSHRSSCLGASGFDRSPGTRSPRRTHVRLLLDRRTCAIHPAHAAGGVLRLLRMRGDVGAAAVTWPLRPYVCGNGIEFPILTWGSVSRTQSTSRSATSRMRRW